jgi:hypothetical protein
MRNTPMYERIKSRSRISEKKLHGLIIVGIIAAVLILGLIGECLGKGRFFHVPPSRRCPPCRCGK